MFCSFGTREQWGTDAVGEQGALGNGDGGTVRNRGQDLGREMAYSIYSVPILRRQTGLGRKAA